MSPPVSKMRNLPPELLETVNEMLDQGVTVSDITRHLHALGRDISCSSVGRYRQEWKESVREMSDSGKFAETVIPDTANRPESKEAQLNAKLIQSALFTSLVAMRTNELAPDKAIPLLLKGAMTQKMINKAAKDDADMRNATDRETQQAEDGDSPAQKNDRLVRVEIVEPKGKTRA